MSIIRMVSIFILEFLHIMVIRLISEHYKVFFGERLGQRAREKFDLKLIVIDIFTEEILEWVD